MCQQAPSVFTATKRTTCTVLEGAPICMHIQSVTCTYTVHYKPSRVS